MKLEHAFNGNHPDSKCPKGKFSYSRHKFTTTNTRRISKGIQEVTLTCKLCGGYTVATEDSNVLAGIFKL